MKTHAFIHEATGVTDVFGRKQGTKVVFEGEGAHTDGTTIKLPSLPQGYDMNQKAVEVFRGYIDHESAHVRHTDWEVSKELFKECEETKRPLLKDMVNVVEDMFIEREQMVLYPGSEKNLTSLTEENDALGLKAIAKIAPENFSGVNMATVTAGLLTYGRKEYGGKHNEELWSKVPKEVQEHVKVWQKAVDKVESTTDSIRVAKAIYKVLRQDPELESNPENFDPNDDGLGDVGEGEGPEVDGEEEGKGDGTLKYPKGLSGPPQGTGQEVLKQMLEGQEDTDVPKDKLEGGGIGKPKGENVVGYRVLTTEYDAVLHRKSPQIKGNTDEAFYQGTHQDYLTLKAKVQDKVTVMKSKLQRVLAAKEMRDWDFAREQGRLDTKRLVGALNGQRNVYKQRKDRAEMDTAVEVLVDCSGSMSHRDAKGNTRIKMAQQVAIILAECFEGTGIQYEISGFTNQYYDYSDLGWGTLYQKAAAKSNRTPYHRVEPLRMYLFKAFKEKLRDAQPSLSTIQKLDLGNNSDRDAILWSLGRLKVRPEKRKVLMVLSDGHPSNRTIGVNYSSLDRAAKEAVLEAQKEVECVGIGIQSEAVRGIYPRYTVVDNIDDLSTKVLRELSNILLDGRKVQL